MAIATDVDSHGLRLLRFRLNTAHARSLADFYEAALGFRRVSLENLSGARMEGLSPVRGRASRIMLELGVQRVELLQFVDRPGRRYPDDGSASDLIFQHFAIVVADMDAAMEQLSTVGGWSPITCDGPQHLPKSSGGVTAFKFRDPEGHPLELLAFPRHDIPKQWQRQGGEGSNPFSGIDHSAISVSGSQRSVAFYESLGLAVSSRGVNTGLEQARLDGVDQPRVEVVAMTANNPTPHLELLCYHHQGKRSVPDLRANDIAATCLVFGNTGKAASRNRYPSPARHLQDPDGHHLSIVDLAIE